MFLNLNYVIIIMSLTLIYTYVVKHHVYDANTRIVIICNLSMNSNIKPFPIHPNNQQKEYENFTLSIS